MSRRTSNIERFEQWYARPLLRLAHDPDAGLLLLMATFPILERYLRAKSGSKPVTADFLQSLIRVIPEVGSEAQAKALWTTYRDQVLHHASYKKPSHWLSHQKAIVEVDDKNRQWLNPALFVERVIAVVRDDFASFEKGVPLPEISVFEAAQQASSVVGYTYLGTGTPPTSSFK